MLLLRKNNIKIYHTFYIRIFDCRTEFQDNKEYEPPHKYFERSPARIWWQHENPFDLQKTYTLSSPFLKEIPQQRNSLITFNKKQKQNNIESLQKLLHVFMCIHIFTSHACMYVAHVCLWSYHTFKQDRNKRNKTYLLVLQTWTLIGERELKEWSHFNVVTKWWMSKISNELSDHKVVQGRDPHGNKKQDLKRVKNEDSFFFFFQKYMNQAK